MDHNRLIQVSQSISAHKTALCSTAEDAVLGQKRPWERLGSVGNPWEATSITSTSVDYEREYDELAYTRIYGSFDHLAL